MTAKGAIDFMAEVYADIRSEVDRVALYRAVVTAVPSPATGFVTIRRVGATTTETVARCAGFKLTVADEVLCAPLKGFPVVVAQMTRAIKTDYELDANLTGTTATFTGAVGTGALTATTGDFSSSLEGETVNAVGGMTVNSVPIFGGHLQSGRAVYLTNIWPLGTLSGILLATNTLYYIPIYVPKDFSIDAFVFEVTTSVAGDVQVGLYTCTSSFLPDTRLVQCTKTATSGTGVKQYTCASTPVTGGRWYFLGLASVTAMSIKGTTTAASIPSPRGGALASDGGATVYCMASESLTPGWTTLPATASPGSASNRYLHVGARVA